MNFTSTPKTDQIRSRIHSRRIAVYRRIVVAVSFIFFGINATVAAGADIEIFNKPPKASELADILFPMTYRALVFEKDNRPKVAKEFGMLINFEFDSTAIVSDSLPYLDSVGQMLKMDNVDDRSIVIEGHTDAKGSEQYNQTLSENRAMAVKRFLVSKYEIDPVRVVVVGKGERSLHDTENPFNEINRRVQFRALN